MMKKMAAVACIVLLLPACAQWKGSARINPSTVAVYPGGKGLHGVRYESGKSRPGAGDCDLTSGLSDSKRGAINLDCFYFPEDRDTRLRAYDRARPGNLAPNFSPVTKSEAQVARNRLAAILVKHADDVCVIEKGRLVATQSSANFALSLLTQGFSGASTIVGGELAKSILSGLATLSAGTQDNVNATFYRNQLVQAIGKSIDGARKRQYDLIVASRPLSTDDFTVDDMVRAVNAYHQACSFEHGLQVLLDAALDSKGAAAALEFQARNRAKVEIQDQLNQLYATKNKGAGNAKIDEYIAELEAKKHGLTLARTEGLISDPNAGDTTEQHPVGTSVPK